jgi:rhodanese-related sulfurtransferase
MSEAMVKSGPRRLAWNRLGVRVVTAALAALLVAAALSGCDRGSSAQASSAQVSAIDGPAAHALVARGATLVDVRTPGEWASGHAEGAVLIPIDELGGRLREIPRDHPVVVYCASGVRSARAAAMLGAAGYTVRDLGSLSRWDG